MKRFILLVEKCTVMSSSPVIIIREAVAVSIYIVTLRKSFVGYSIVCESVKSLV